MKICVLGAGVVGVSTAFALSRAGHEVHVIDRGSDVASGVSAANGAQLSYSYVDPFACPATFRKLPAYIMGTDPAVRLGLSFSPSYLRWGLEFMRQCTSGRARENLKRRTALAALSQKALQSFAQSCGEGLLNPTGRGKIVLASNNAQLDNMKILALKKKELGIPVTVISKQDCIDLEPALNNWQGKWAGGLYANQDHALNPQDYCKVLRNHAEKHYGTKFHFEESILSVTTIGGAVQAVETDHALHSCDQIILCLGPQANKLLKPLGLSIPLYPIQGYSLTLPVKPEANAASITDLKHKIVFANLGNKIRIAGFMDTHQSPKKSFRRCHQLHALARNLWPSIADYDAEPNYWIQSRPMIPSGVPIIKQSEISGLYLNVGHGSLGYTFAAGSAMVITDLIAQEITYKEPEMERTSYA